MIFQDRQDAGKKLAKILDNFKGQKNIIILALPRGGVVTAYAITKILKLPLDIIVPRKISAPFNEEYAIGAITESGQGIFDQNAIANYQISQDYINRKIREEQKEAKRRLKLYRSDLPPLNLRDKTVIIVDDGIATGLTMRAAIISVKKKKAKKIIVAIPVAAQNSLEVINKEVNQVICLEVPQFFGAVGEFYNNFQQTTDQEVINLMAEAKNF